MIGLYDTNGDYKVDKADVDLISSYAGTRFGDKDYKGDMDLNSDGIVTDEDAGILKEVISRYDNNSDGALNSAFIDPDSNDVDRIRDVAYFYINEAMGSLDFNNDGKVDILDRIYYTDAMSVRDLTGDGKVTSDDLTRMEKIIGLMALDINPDEVRRADVTRQASYTVTDGSSARGSANKDGTIEIDGRAFTLEIDDLTGEARLVETHVSAEPVTGSIVRFSGMLYGIDKDELGRFVVTDGSKRFTKSIAVPEEVADFIADKLKEMKK